MLTQVLLWSYLLHGCKIKQKTADYKVYDSDYLHSSYLFSRIILLFTYIDSATTMAATASEKDWELWLIFSLFFDLYQKLFVPLQKL